jgi:hypothetical protein
MAKQTVYAYEVQDSDGKSAQLYFTEKQVPPSFNEADMIEAKEAVKDNIASLDGKGIYYLRSALDTDERKALVAGNQKVCTVRRMGKALDALQAACVSVAQAKLTEAEVTELYNTAATLLNQFKATALHVKASKTKTDRFAHLFNR